MTASAADSLHVLHYIYRHINSLTQLPCRILKVFHDCQGNSSLESKGKVFFNIKKPLQQPCYRKGSFRGSRFEIRVKQELATTRRVPRNSGSTSSFESCRFLCYILQFLQAIPSQFGKYDHAVPLIMQDLQEVLVRLSDIPSLLFNSPIIYRAWNSIDGVRDRSWK